MRGKNHFISGVVAGTITAISLFNGSYMGAGALAVTAAIGSIVPDIDLPTSTLGKKVKPISTIINKLFGHRTITHAPIWLIPLFLLYYNFDILNLSATPHTLLKYCLIGYITGFICHLLGDMFTIGGIPLLYPFNKKRFHLGGGESGKYDIIILLVLSILFAGFFIFCKKFAII